MSSPITTPEQAVRATQTITISMFLGVMLFGLVAVFGVGVLDEPAGGFIVSVVGAAFACGAFVLHLVVPNLIKPPPGADVGGRDDLPLYQQYQARTIVGLALLEGAAFFNIIAAIVEHKWWSLAVAGALVFWMLAMFPTRTRIRHWVETQRLSGP